ncbi:MAG TPA: hypothetical protein VF519_11440 [Mycobacteriales bacterium]|jgi:hypothetical protein
MTHDDARRYASMRADGEAAPDPGLDAHLASCAGCAAYADGLARLTTLTAALPREAAPRRLAQRVARRRARRRLLRWSPALAAATAAAYALTVLPAGPATFPAPAAAAAEPLRHVRSLYVERTVTGDGADATERIWFRAPASVRVDRTAGGVTETTIRTPGLVYAGGVLVRDAVPEIPLPEPLSPTVALLGTDTGPGPAIAGRPTRRIVLEVAGERRTAFVDVERALALGGDEALVLGKQSARVTKRVTRVDRDPVIPDSVFAPPPGAGPAVDGGFRRRALGDLSIEPAALPRGFAPVLSGRVDGGEYALLADGSLPLLVTTTGSPPERADVRTVTRGERTYAVTLPLYDVPAVEFTRGGVPIRLQAPLPVESLVDLAERMYPRE